LVLTGIAGVNRDMLFQTAAGVPIAYVPPGTSQLVLPQLAVINLTVSGALNLSGSLSLASLTLSGALIADTVAAATSLTAPTLSVSGTTNLNALNVTGATSFAALGIVGALTSGSLNTGALVATGPAVLAGTIQLSNYTAGYIKLDNSGVASVISNVMFAENVSGVAFQLRSGTANDSLLAIGYTPGIEFFLSLDKDGTGLYRPLSVYVGGGLAYSISTSQQITFTGPTSSPAFNSTAGTDSSSPATGAILTLGGLGVLKKAFFGDNVTTAQRFRSAPVGSAIVVSMWQDGANARIGTETAHDLNLVRNGVTLAAVTATGLESFGTIKSVAPTGGTSQPWKFGEVIVAAQPTHDRTVRVEINGQVLFLAAHT
jgi:hypothetical protein